MNVKTRISIQHVLMNEISMAKFSRKTNLTFQFQFEKNFENGQFVSVWTSYFFATDVTFCILQRHGLIPIKLIQSYKNESRNIS